MSLIPEDLKYTKEHEWIKVQGKKGIIGITDHAQKELTDVVYVELPSKGKIVKRGEELCVVESVKAVSEVYAPVSGKVVDVNAELDDHPEYINEDPYGKGWITVLEFSSDAELKELLSPRDYRKLVGE